MKHGIDCATCQHPRCPSTTTRERNPHGGCMEWQTPEVLAWIATLPVINMDERAQQDLLSPAQAGAQPLAARQRKPPTALPGRRARPEAVQGRLMP